MRIDNDVIITNKLVVICENQVKDVLIPCRPPYILLEEEFFRKVEEGLSLSTFRTSVLAVLNTCTVFTCVLENGFINT